ncbi:MAG: magnesium transporter [Planctomycetota bacterium]
MADAAGSSGAVDEVLERAAEAEARVGRLIECDADAVELAPAIAEQEAPDAADSLERLAPEESAEVLAEMEDRAAAEALAHMEPQLAATVFPDLSDGDAAKLLQMMGPDDAADILHLLEAGRVGGLLGLMHPKRAAELRRIALDDPESAAGIMTTEIGVIREGLSIGEAIGFVKRHSATEDQTELYIVDGEKRLIGAISLRDLLVQDDDRAVSEFMIEVHHPLPHDLDREEVARLFERYDLLTAPVIDPADRVLGMVTIDDVVDIIAAEHTEDALKQVGAAGDEAVYSTFGKKLRSRLPWLIVNLVTSQIAAAIILVFADLIELIPVVAAVFPIIANQSGNAGSQSFALTLRGLVSGEIRTDRLGRLLGREAAFGLIAGVIVGVIFACVVAGLGAIGVFESANWRLGVVAGISMTGAMWAGCLIGVGMPIAMQRVGIDPATATSIFLTMLSDAISFAAFLGLVFLLREWVAPGVVV